MFWFQDDKLTDTSYGVLLDEVDMKLIKLQ